MTSGLLNPAGRIAVIGYSSLSSLGTAQTSYLTRTGRFDQALPEYCQWMQLAGNPADHRAYVDRNVGIRVIRPKDTEEGYDPQRFESWPEVILTEPATINGRNYSAGSKVRIPKVVQHPVSHAGVLPAGWNILAGLGLEGSPFNEFSRDHQMMAYLLAQALVMTGVPFSEIEARVSPEQRIVAGGPALAPGRDIFAGMAHPILARPVPRNIVARYEGGNSSFWLARWLNARHASNRVAACNQGIANMENIVAAMRTGEFLFGALATFESAINAPSIVGFSAQMALSTDQSVAKLKDHPSLASRPGMKDRSGFVMGEGGGMFLLMEMSLAFAMGLPIYAELLSARTATGPRGSIDAAAPTNGVILALERGLRDIAELDGISIEEVVRRLGWISGHGTSTPAGDINGASCYETVLERYGRKPGDPVFLTYQKGGPRIWVPTARAAGGIGIGHCLGGSAMLAAVENVMIHGAGIVPPAVDNLAGVDPAILELERVVYATQPLQVDPDEAVDAIAIAEAEGFGDSNGGGATRGYRAGRYEGGSEAESRQVERRDWRDEQLEAIRQDKMKLGQFLPPLTAGK